jgi:Lrp/AsnC family leucine-responsive transcriptional regulator
MDTNRTLDSLDLRILDILQHDCTTPRSHIAELVGLSPPAVLERIRKLEEAGVVRGFHALLDSRKLGFDVTAFIGVSLAHPRHIAQFEREIAEVLAVQECHHVTGDFTLLIKVRTANTAGLEHLISQIRSVEGVQRTVTMVVLSTQVERFDLELPGDAGSEAASARSVPTEERSGRDRARRR